MNQYLIIVDDVEKEESPKEKFDDMDSFNNRKENLKDKGFRVTRTDQKYRNILNGCNFVIASNRLIDNNKIKQIKLKIKECFEVTNNAILTSEDLYEILLPPIIVNAWQGIVTPPAKRPDYNFIIHLEKALGELVNESLIKLIDEGYKKVDQQ